MFKQLVYGLFLVVLVTFSVFVFAENITGDEIDNSSMINYTNDSVSELPYTSEDDSLINTILSMTLDKMSFTKGEIMPVSVRLTTEDNISISNEDIYFFLDEISIGDSPTNSEGVATAYFDTSTITPGQYIVSADYYGLGLYDLSNDYEQIIIDGNDSAPAIEEILPVEEIVIDEEILPAEEDNIFSNIENIPSEKILSQDQLLSERITPSEECINEQYFEETPVIGVCVESRTICVNESTNETCETANTPYECITGVEKVAKTREKCTAKEYVFDNKIKFSIEGYSCSIGKDASYKIMICDSIYDGNGDGICSSGESCMKFVIVDEEFVQYEKNSRDTFVKEDASYFTNRIYSEVLE